MGDVFHLDLFRMRFQVTTVHSFCRKACKDFLTELPAEHPIVITPEDISAERQKILDSKNFDGDPEKTPDFYIEYICLLRKLADYCLSYDRMFIHGSAICVDGKGYLFTAPSGTGKSTHTALLRRHFGDRAVMVNDDKPFVLLEGRQAYICGSPWMGKHHLGNPMIVPLCGIFFLRRAQDNTLQAISPENALSAIMCQCYRPTDPESLTKSLDLIDRLLTSTPLYDFGCNQDPSAAALSASVMK